MTLIIIIYILVFAIFALCGYAVMQIKLLGLKVKDFWDFIEANEMLDKLNKFAKQYQAMSPQEQVIYLAEAEKIFTAFDKVPEELWDEEYECSTPDAYHTTPAAYIPPATYYDRNH